MTKLAPTLRRALAVAAIALAPVAAQPAAAQFFWSPPDFSAPPLTDEAAANALGLPGATAAEIKAGLAWNVRAALNVAALQCDFDPTLLTTSNYNAMIAHHDAELDEAQAGLLGYFQRIKGKGKPGQTASDRYNTRIYSSYSTVQAQKGFCQAAARMGARGDLRRSRQAERSGAQRPRLHPQGDRAGGRAGLWHTGLRLCHRAAVTGRCMLEKGRAPARLSSGVER